MLFDNQICTWQIDTYIPSDCVGDVRHTIRVFAVIYIGVVFFSVEDVEDRYAKRGVCTGVGVDRP